MTTHRYHPDPMRGDPPDAVLYDACERCTEHAERLTYLDADNLAELYRLVVSDDPARTYTEAHARNRLELAVLITDRARNAYTRTQETTA